jgi:hypothetical protein
MLLSQINFLPGNSLKYKCNSVWRNKGIGMRSISLDLLSAWHVACVGRTPNKVELLLLVIVIVLHQCLRATLSLLRVSQLRYRTMHQKLHFRPSLNTIYFPLVKWLLHWTKQNWAKQNWTKLMIAVLVVTLNFVNARRLAVAPAANARLAIICVHSVYFVCFMLDLRQ